MAKRANEPPLPRGLSEEQREEILERRRRVAEELAAREAERQSAWKEHEQERLDAEARRKATEPSKEFIEEARAARERLEKERAAGWRRGFENESKRRNPDEKLEERFRKTHADVFDRHLALFARVQEAMSGGDERAKREAVRAMAAAWKEKEDLLVALAAATRKKSAPDPLEARAEFLRSKLEALEKNRKALAPKGSKRKAKRDAASGAADGSKTSAPGKKAPTAKAKAKPASGKKKPAAKK